MNHPANFPGIPNAAPMKVIRAERCEKCKWAEKQPTSPILECHKNPPATAFVMTPKGPSPVSHFALVQPTQWCGDFQTKIDAVN